MNPKSGCRFNVLLIMTILGCSTEPDTTPRLFAVRIDSLQHPSSVAINDTITIRLFGIIGGDGCHSFHTSKTPNNRSSWT